MRSISTVIRCYSIKKAMHCLTILRGKSSREEFGRRGNHSYEDCQAMHRCFDVVTSYNCWNGTQLKALSRWKFQFHFSNQMKHLTADGSKQLLKLSTWKQILTVFNRRHASYILSESCLLAKFRLKDDSSKGRSHDLKVFNTIILQ